MGKIWEKIKLFCKTKVLPWLKQKWTAIWDRIKKFYFEKVLPWANKNWFEITNLLILVIVHLMIRNVPDTGVADFIIKTWILAIVVHYLWIKLKKYII